MFDFSKEVMASQGTCLFYVGQAGYIIKSRSGQLLAVDLYLSDCVEREEGNMGFKRLLPHIIEPEDIEFDVIVCTHPHMDHFDVDAVPKMISNGRTKLFCSVNCEELVNRYKMDLHSNTITYVKPGDKVKSGDFDISFVNCDHGAGAPDAVGVVVNVDGKVIYETGDTCLQLDIINEIPKQLDVLIAPINGAYGNLNEADCAVLAENLKPKTTIPCHYGMFASHHGDIGKFYDIMIEKELPHLIMKQGEKYIL